MPGGGCHGSDGDAITDLPSFRPGAPGGEGLTSFSGSALGIRHIIVVEGDTVILLSWVGFRV